MLAMLVAVSPASFVSGCHASEPARASRDVRAPAAPSPPKDAPPPPTTEPRPPEGQSDGAPPPWICGGHFETGDFDGFQHAQDLAAAGRLFTSARGRRGWTSGMEGRATPDLLGRTLPAFVTKARAIAWTGHPSPDEVTLVTARRWTDQGNDWIVMAEATAALRGERHRLMPSVPSCAHDRVSARRA